MKDKTIILGYIVLMMLLTFWQIGDADVAYLEYKENTYSNYGIILSGFIVLIVQLHCIFWVIEQYKLA